MARLNYVLVIGLLFWECLALGPFSYKLSIHHCKCFLFLNVFHLENVISTCHTKDFYENNGSNFPGFNSFEICKKNTTSSQNIEQFFFLNVLHMLALGRKLAISVG